MCYVTIRDGPSIKTNAPTSPSQGAQLLLAKSLQMPYQHKGFSSSTSSCNSRNLKTSKGHQGTMRTPKTGCKGTPKGTPQFRKVIELKRQAHAPPSQEMQPSGNPMPECNPNPCHLANQILATCPRESPNPGSQLSAHQLFLF